MNDEQLLRYSRQILLPEIDHEGQQKLLDSHVVIFGMGGLGSPAAMYLAAAGIGELTLVDPDQVDLSNLQRQIIHDTASIGKDKTESAKETLHALNEESRVNCISHKPDIDEITSLVEAADLVLDCTDNFKSRYDINAASVATNTPLVSGAAIRWEGQLSVFNAEAESPCYQCLYPPTGEEDTNCTTNGVAAPVVGIIGAMQAVEAIKLLIESGQSLSGRLLIMDMLTMQHRTMSLKADPTCPVCSKAR